LIRQILFILCAIFLSKTAIADLIPTNSASHNLPSHWRSYWLDEPEFGTQMFVTDTGKISAPVVMLVHGLGQNGLRDWLRIVPALEQNYRVVLLDLPGFANSPTPIAKLSPDRYVRLLHFVKTRFSTKPITVVGHSMGAAVTLGYAHQFPDDIKQIAIIDAAGILQRTAFVKHSATDRIPLNTELLPNPLLAYVVGLQDVGNNMIEKMLRLPDPTAILNKNEMVWGMTLKKYPNINAALSLIEENFSAAIFEQQKPVFILWGKQDQVAPLRTGQLLFANITHSKLNIIDDAGHSPMLSHPQLVSQYLLSNFNTLPPAKNISNNVAHNQNYECKNSVGDVLRGHYNRIVIDECTAVLLDEVTANELIVSDSLIEIVNSRFIGDSSSSQFKNAVVMMTSGSIKGVVNLNNSRVDFAGVNFFSEKPFSVTAKSRLVLSVSRAGVSHYLHLDKSLENTSF
jgi:pimeloyl-ACP methyl ester carboxylesterase